MAVVIETTLGDFTVDLYTEERPQTCRNFLKLCKVKYYNWNLFFTIQSNFIAQTGDPTATGKGGSSIHGIVLGDKARFYEAEKLPKLKHDKVGLISMVNCGDNMVGSQFFITLAPDLQSLDGEHCVFGEITEGLEIILKFNEAICDVDHRPYQDIRISHTVILEDPYDDPEGLAIPDRSPSPTREALMSDRIGADEVIDDTAGMTEAEIIEMQKEKEAKARATILEIVGDIPDADMAPPENVLFVCKLNPVTNDDDLEIIFSRFGKIVGCEVIRDKQTGDSLQYAFIEFGDRKSCEDAYFKMDNVLIDDRRIHVDFSQSVAKMRWRGKGKGFIYNDERKDSDGKKDKARDDRRVKNDRPRSRSRSPRRDRNRGFDDRGKFEPRRDDRRRQESHRNGDVRRRDDRDERSSRRRQERSESRSREKARDRKERSRSKERRVRDRRDRSGDRKGKKDKSRENSHREESRSSKDTRCKKKQKSSSSSSEEERVSRKDSKKKDVKRKKKVKGSSSLSSEEEERSSKRSEGKKKDAKKKKKRRNSSSSSSSSSSEEEEQSNKRSECKKKDAKKKKKQKDSSSSSEEEERSSSRRSECKKKESKKKKKQKDSSSSSEEEERNERSSDSKKRRKSRDRSEERSSHKHKHKHKSNR